MQILENQITVKELGNLCKKSTNEKVVSIIISSSTVPDLNKKLQVKFKNSIKQVEELINSAGEDSKPYLKLLDQIDIETEILKIPRTRTLVIYVTYKDHQIFNLTKSIAETPIVTYSESRVIKHLITEMNMEYQFLVLDLSLNDINVYLVNKYEIEEYKMLDIPKSLKDEYDVEREGHQQHSVSTGGVFHGHGGKKDEQDAMTKSFLLAIDKELIEKLNEQKIPVMLSGAENIIALYKSISKYQYIWDSAIEGNIDRFGLAQIHERALEALEKHDNSKLREIVERINNQRDAGRGSDSFEKIFEAAIEGRVDNLVIKSGYSAWGKYENEKLDVSLSKREEDEDLVNLLICMVLGTAGKAYIDASEDSTNEILAEFRY